MPITLLVAPPISRPSYGLVVRGLQKYARNFKFHDAFFSYQQDVLHCFGPKKAIIGIKFLV